MKPGVGAMPSLGMWGFPKIRVAILEVPRIRIIVSWGVHWDPLFSGYYHVGVPERDYHNPLWSRLVGGGLGLWLNVWGSNLSHGVWS